MNEPSQWAPKHAYNMSALYMQNWQRYEGKGGRAGSGHHLDQYHETVKPSIYL